MFVIDVLAKFISNSNHVIIQRWCLHTLTSHF